MLVLAESCILFAGVVSRYVFDSPIIWTDELATFLFLWMAMFGAVVLARKQIEMGEDETREAAGMRRLDLHADEDQLDATHPGGGR